MICLNKTLYLNCEWCGDYHQTHVVSKLCEDMFKGELFTYPKKLLYCEKSGVHYENKKYRKLNSLQLSDAYKRKHGLLTNNDISHFLHTMNWTPKTLSMESGVCIDHIRNSFKKLILSPDEDKAIRKVMHRYGYKIKACTK